MTDLLDRLAAALADRYTIERELGAGGMATVYLAHDLKHDRKVAVKVLRPELAAVIGAERFLSEIKTTANLQHPHILALFDSGTADGFLYYVMPYVDGESLRDRLSRERQLDIAQSREIARQIASALAYAHEHGIVHRDIKPENILLSRDHAIVADFGIARAVGAAGGAQLTATGTAIGTPAYMSPEQSAGMSDVDGRSDTYSLATMLYEMLAGEAPYTGATAAAIIAKRLGTTAPSVRVLRDSVPKQVDAALQRALQRAPADRFATATEFAAAIGSTAMTSGLHLSRRALVATLAVLAIGAAAWFGLHRKASDTGLDANVIAVLPFRVGSDNTSINYLRESMLDLLDARLNSGSGARIVEPSTLLAAWHRAVHDERSDLSVDDSRALARQLGAGRVLLGSAVATPTELTLTASLLQTGDGKVLARESVAGSPDSVAALVNRLTASLLIRGAGNAADDDAGLAAEPLDALQDYLAGRKAFRVGDYFSAMVLYRKALARDSTFVQAAFRMVATNAWIGTVVDTSGLHVIPEVWRMRDRLSARDRALFLAIQWVGPNYPGPSSYREVIAQAERATSLAPDNPEAWVLLGQLLSHYGAASTQHDWARRSADALDRAIALDSSFDRGVQERIFTALRANDSSATVRYAALYGRLVEQHAVSGMFDNLTLWSAARAVGDSSAARKWRERNVGMTHDNRASTLGVIALHSGNFALPLDDARWAVTTLRREVVTDVDRIGLMLAESALGFAAGQAEPVALLPPWVSSPILQAGAIEQALIEPLYRTLVSTTIPGAAPADCGAALFRFESGDTNGVGQAIRALTALIGNESAPIRADLRVCPFTLQALVESRTSGASRPFLDRLDSLMHDGPQAFSGATVVVPAAYANFLVARLRAAQGDTRGALAAIRRRAVDYFPSYLWSLPAFLRQEGRLAATVGDTAGAMRAYDQYLAMRANPDPLFRPQRDSVIAERGALKRPR
ncbi:MAG: serine/threonine-protein kinase [Gemmatimonadota bacterium]